MSYETYIQIDMTLNYIVGRGISETCLYISFKKSLEVGARSAPTSKGFVMLV